MKKLCILAMAVCLGCSVTAAAQAAQNCNMGQGNATTSAPLKTLNGTVKSEGDKITFVTDVDNKSWDVINPETLKDHVGHHVQVSAHVYADKDQIHVMSVKMLKAKSSAM
jgi:hypothetical protein